MPEIRQGDGTILYVDEGPQISPGQILDRLLESSKVNSLELTLLEKSIKTNVTEFVNHLLVLRDLKFDSDRNEHLQKLIIRFGRKTRRSIEVYVLKRKKKSLLLNTQKSKIESFKQESLGAYFLYTFLLFHNGSRK